MILLGKPAIHANNAASSNSGHKPRMHLKTIILNGVVVKFLERITNFLKGLPFEVIAFVVWQI
jgi:hypothetical protein